jgi:hypothetical protein
MLVRAMIRSNFWSQSIVYPTMNTFARPQKTVLYCIFAGTLLLAGSAFAEGRSMNCDSRVPTTHAQLVEGDQSTATHLELSRKVPLGASVDLDVCAADLTIVASNNNLLQVTVDIGNPAPKLSALDYLQALDVTSQQARGQLHLPENARAKVWSRFQR